MRVLHLVKTSDGASWAALQAGELVRNGIEVHVAVPSLTGRCMPRWAASGARIHACDTAFDPRHPWRLLDAAQRLRALVDAVDPDVVHAHFVVNAVAMRLALRSRPSLPRVFQVPGPLHLEHAFTRALELSTADRSDHWIASSRYIRRLYLEHGVDPRRVHLGYYGTDTSAFSSHRTGVLRQRLGIPAQSQVVGSISWMYPPKRWLGQQVGLKCHEDLIAALGRVIAQRADVVGVLAGGAWNGAAWYEERLRRLAADVGKGRILFPGPLDDAAVRDAWADFDCVVHVPMSENCGGVLEPLLAGVPVISSRVGGLPEVIEEGATGTLVPARDPVALSAAITRVLDDPVAHRNLAANGRQRVLRMFSIERTAADVLSCYRNLVAAAGRQPDRAQAHAT